jgi:hypothetical protein
MIIRLFIPLLLLMEYARPIFLQGLSGKLFFRIYAQFTELNMQIRLWLSFSRFYLLKIPGCNFVQLSVFMRIILVAFLHVYS